MAKEIFQQLVDVADQWSKFVERKENWTYNAYRKKGSLAVHSYFAADHRALHFDVDGLDQIHIGFHDTPKIEMSAESAADIKRIVKVLRKSLTEARKERKANG